MMEIDGVAFTIVEAAASGDIMRKVATGDVRGSGGRRRVWKQRGARKRWRRVREAADGDGVGYSVDS